MRESTFTQSSTFTYPFYNYHYICEDASDEVDVPLFGNSYVFATAVLKTPVYGKENFLGQPFRTVELEIMLFRVLSIFRL